jgi:O-antigen ligase
LLANYGKIKFLAVPFLVLTLNAILLTQSRGGMLGIAVAGLVALFWVPKRSRRMFRLYLVLAVAGGATLMGPQIIERLNSIKVDEESGRREKSAESRLVIIEAQLEMFKLAPLVGQGHRGTLRLSPLYIPEEYMTSAKGGSMVRGSHNLTMSYLVDHGLVGAFLYFSILLIVFIRGIRIRAWLLRSGSNIAILYIGCTLALISVLITSQFSNSMRLEIDVWFIAMLSLLYQWIEKSRQDDSAKSNVHGGRNSTAVQV